MTAWDSLKAASSLLVGNAWTLISNPRTGVVVNDGITVELGTMQVDVELQDSPITAEVVDTSYVVEVSTQVIEVEICE